jgi:hypothetical protein
MNMRSVDIRNSSKRRLAFTGALLALGMLLTGSVGCSAMKQGSLEAVKPVTAKQRVGSVYLLRGWIGIFSTGIDSLGEKINAAGIHAEVYQESQWSELADAIIRQYEREPSHEPIVIVGHSYGADDSILITRKLAEKNIKVDLVVTLDPVTPRKVPSNIRLAYNLYQSSALDGLPFLRGIPLTPDSPGPVTLKNMNIRTDRTDLLEDGLDHFNIEKKEKVHADVIAQVMKACPPRSVWTANQAPRQLIASAGTATGGTATGGTATGGTAMPPASPIAPIVMMAPAGSDPN